MTQKVIVDRDYRPVPEGDPRSAFSLPVDDPRIVREAPAEEPAETPEPAPEKPPRRQRSRS